MAIEDSRFYEHSGIDLRGTLRALVDQHSHRRRHPGRVDADPAVRQERAARPTARTDEDRARGAARATVARKLRELRYAIGAGEALHQGPDPRGLPEHRLLRRRGVRRRGRRPPLLRHLGRRPQSGPQAATLAGIVQQPGGLRPARATRRLPRSGATSVLRRMAEVDLIAQARRRRGDRRPDRSHAGHPPRRRTAAATSPAPFFCDYVVNTFLHRPAFGETADDREALLKPRRPHHPHHPATRWRRRAAQAAVERRIPVDDPSGKAAAIAHGRARHRRRHGDGAEPPLRQRQAPGRPRQLRRRPRATAAAIGMQAGSTFKVVHPRRRAREGLPARTSGSPPRP